jgi:hypothetical protein
MNRRLAKAALALYPLAFRRRYGDEMRAAGISAALAPSDGAGGRQRGDDS